MIYTHRFDRLTFSSGPILRTGAGPIVYSSDGLGPDYTGDEVTAAPKSETIPIKRDALQCSHMYGHAYVVIFLYRSSYIQISDSEPPLGGERSNAVTLRI